MRNANFVAGNMLMFFVGVIMFATLALQPTMLQQLMHYPVATAGLVIAPRGIGTMIGMFLVGRIINRVDIRLIILTGLALTALSLYQMSGFSLVMDMQPIVVSGLIQGFGLGFVFVPLSTISFATLPARSDPRHRLVQPDTQHRQQHRHRDPRGFVCREQPDRAFAPRRTFAPG